MENSERPKGVGVGRNRSFEPDIWRACDVPASEMYNNKDNVIMLIN